ncbi:MAG: hypothetical protein QW607_10225 [Desulfurococcaceae archaeon]|nr:hypothetical protein [Candidatus Aenigmarchaeota archaeon]
MSKELIEEAIEKYNKYRSPEATARLVYYQEDKFLVEFSGYFCLTCGYYDYFEDLIYILKEMGLRAKTEKIEEKENNITLVTFILLK